MILHTPDEYAAAIDRASRLRAGGAAADTSVELAELEAAIEAFEAERHPRDTPGRPALRSVAPNPAPVTDNRPGTFTPPRPGQDRDG